MDQRIGDGLWGDDWGLKMKDDSSCMADVMPLYPVEANARVVGRRESRMLGAMAQLLAVRKPLGVWSVGDKKKSSKKSAVKSKVMPLQKQNGGRVSYANVGLMLVQNSAKKDSFTVIKKKYRLKKKKKVK